MHTINGVAFEPPNVPVLLQILSGTTDPAKLMPNGSIYALPGNKTIEISIPGFFPVSGRAATDREGILTRDVASLPLARTQLRYCEVCRTDRT